MEDSFSSSNCTDKEDCISESKSNLSLSVGYFPWEDSIAWKDTNTSEDRTSEGSSCHFLPAAQESWAIKTGRMPIRSEKQIQDDQEQLCELPITWVLDAYLGCEHEDSCLATLNLNGDNQRMDKFPQEMTNQILWELDDLMKNLKAFLDNQKDDKDNDPVFSDSPLDEDLQLSSTVPSHVYQVSDKNHEACYALPKCKPPEIEDISQFLEMSPWLEEDELAEVSTKLPQCRERDRPSGGARLDSMESNYLL
ncbi:hypothetical protein SUZIE_126135 [Sciurus carolinensis]|uniref:Uncharacterized protein n=1 Tax=Sciurus carolinensis TaxID=30640 RepID=A0AA41MLR5_SCICA|nr:hypothetical protein [Sciurus carolinensis]